MLSQLFFFFLLFRRPPGSTLFLYTTLFRSDSVAVTACGILGGPACRSVLVIAGNGAVTVLIGGYGDGDARSEEHTSELQSLTNLVWRLLLENKEQHDDDEHDRDLVQREPGI